MQIKHMLLAGFILVSLVQIYVPASMILNREDVLKNGKLFRFRTAPVDPSNPFMGKYIVLDFADNTVLTGGGNEWISNEKVYVTVSTNKEGFAIIDNISRERPDEGSDYFMSSTGAVRDSLVFVDFPFDRYYMEESKSLEAEQAYRKSMQDGNSETWALVSIKNGEAVLTDVLIDGIPIREVVNINRNKPD